MALLARGDDPPQTPPDSRAAPGGAGRRSEPLARLAGRRSGAASGSAAGRRSGGACAPPAGRRSEPLARLAYGQKTWELAVGVLDLLRANRQTVAVAESLTGGLVAAALTDVPGSSEAFRGGVVAYATSLKAELLGVDAELLAEHGPVYAPVAAAMARGVRERLKADWGAATTGVAGPDPADGYPPGTVHIAVSGAEDVVVRTISLAGNRDEVRRLTVERTLGLLLGRLREDLR